MGECSEPGCTKGGILPSSSCAWRLWSESFGTPSRVSRLCFPLNTWLAVCCESSKIFPIPIFYNPHPYSSPPLLKILEPHQNKFILPALTAPNPVFSFFPLDQLPLPLRVGPACFQRSWTLENSQPPYRRRGMGGQPNGDFFFLPSPSYNIL